MRTLATSIALNASHVRHMRHVRHVRIAQTAPNQHTRAQSLSTRSDGNRYGQWLGQPFDRIDQLVYEIAQSLFDALGEGLFVVTHVARLFFSMRPRLNVSTARRAFVAHVAL
jgi:hypothetical protein